MNAQSRRKIEMGRRVLEFCRDHPDPEPGSDAQVARLEQLLARANEVAMAQRDGLIHVRAASERKRELRSEMLKVPIRHLVKVGQTAARERHELGNLFRFRPSADSYLAFATAARSMVAAAEENRELLLKYGLSQSVLDNFKEKVDEFEAAIALGNDGRTAHVGATRELPDLSSEIVGSIGVMDARNRERFAEDGQLLGSWLGASRILCRPRPNPDPEGGETGEAAA